MRILVGAWANRSGVGDGDGKDANIVEEIESSVRKIDIRVQDFQDFLLKSEMISQLIIYESKLLLYSHAIISVFVHDISFCSSNISFKDLAMMHLCYFCTHTPYF